MCTHISSTVAFFTESLPAALVTTEAVLSAMFDTQRPGVKSSQRPWWQQHLIQMLLNKAWRDTLKRVNPGEVIQQPQAYAVSV